MAYDASQVEEIFRLWTNNSAPCEKEEMELSDNILSEFFEKYDSFEMQQPFGRFVCIVVPDEEPTEETKRERIKSMIYMLLLAIFLGNNDNLKFFATPDRGKISCITVYLLGNDGAHSYNGNGILMTTRRKYARLTDEELLDEIRPANIPLDVLQRRPTDREIARLSGKLGQEYRLLAFELGLTRVQLDHLTLDYPTTLLRIERMLFIWRDDIEDNATFEILVKAMCMHGINPDIVNQSLERA